MFLRKTIATILSILGTKMVNGTPGKNLKVELKEVPAPFHGAITELMYSQEDMMTPFCINGLQGSGMNGNH